VRTELTGKMETAAFGVLRRAKVALGVAEGGARRKNCNSQDQTMAAGCILTHAGSPKWKSRIILDTLPLTLEGTVACVRRAMANFPQSRLVGLVDPRGKDIIELLRLGLSGLVQASTDLEADLASAITTIHRGSIWVPESVLLEHAARVQSLIDCHLAPHTVLSAREVQVLDSVTWGRSNKEIASVLTITERTVKFHVSNILSKLGLERRTELVRWHEPI
jgi:DNA-binding NarL/FixJ family response regulator